MRWKIMFHGVRRNVDELRVVLMWNSLLGFAEIDASLTTISFSKFIETYSHFYFVP
jgi:hypothetical protein